MDESKKAEIRAILSLASGIFPWIKTFETLEAEAEACGAELRSYCIGYFQGVRAAMEIAQRQPRRIMSVAREPRDITNLWGLLS